MNVEFEYQARLHLSALRAARDAAQRACERFLAGDGLAEDLWRTFLQEQDRAFERLEHRIWNDHPAAKAVRDDTLYCRKKAAGVIAYLRAARNSAHHGLRPVSSLLDAYYQVSHPLLGQLNVRDGFNLMMHNNIVVDGSGRGQLLPDHSIVADNGQLYVAGDIQLSAEHVPTHMRLFDVIDERDEKMRITSVPFTPFGSSEAANYMACFAMDILNWLALCMDRAISSERF